MPAPATLDGPRPYLLGCVQLPLPLLRCLQLGPVEGLGTLVARIEGSWLSHVNINDRRLSRIAPKS
jgi:hypothetical protein